MGTIAMMAVTPAERALIELLRRDDNAADVTAWTIRVGVAANRKHSDVDERGMRSAEAVMRALFAIVAAPYGDGDGIPPVDYNPVTPA